MRLVPSTRRTEARVTILSGEGKAFCAGGDIGAWGALPPLEMWRSWTRAGHRAFEALARLRTPLIVALTGTPSVAAWNWRRSAIFASPNAASDWACPRPASAWRLAGRGRSGWSVVSAHRSFAAWHSPDSCSRATPRLRSASSTRSQNPVKDLARAEAMAADIARRGPIAVQIVKAMINFAEGEDPDAPIEGLAGGLTAMTQDLAEGVAAFRAKRAPTFRNS